MSQLDAALRALLDAARDGRDARPYLEAVVAASARGAPPSRDSLATWTPDTDEVDLDALCRAVLDGRIELSAVLSQAELWLAGVDPASDRYEPGPAIGSGGTADVHVVHDPELDREVALKILRRTDGPSRAAFLREARLTARLEHPSIVPVHDVGQTADGHPFLAMKRVRGRSLREALQARPSWSLRRRLEIFRSVCDALAFAHDRGIVHLDLKPENVMLGEYGEILVMDWGVARALDEPAPERVGGTPAYMAPEQARGGPVGKAADVWALGLLLRELCDDPPRELAALVRRCLAVRPEDRFADAADVAAEVRAWLDDRELASVSYRPWERLAKWSRRNGAAVRTFVVTGGIALAVLAGATFAYVARLGAARDVAEVAAIEARRQLTASLLSQGDAQRLAGEPLAAGASYERARAELLEIGDPTLRADLALADLAAAWPRPIVLSGLEGDLQGLSISPEGDRALAWTVGPTSAVLLELPVGEVRVLPLADRGPAHARFVAGRPLVAWARDGDLVVTDADTGADLQVVPGAAAGAASVRVLLTEFGACIRGADEVCRWRLFDLATGAPSPLLAPDAPELERESGGWSFSSDGRYVFAGGSLGRRAFERGAGGPGIELGDSSLIDDVRGRHGDGSALIDLRTGEAVWTIPHAPPATLRAFSPDPGWMLTMQSHDNIVRILDEDTGRVLDAVPLRLAPGGAHSFAAHRGRRLAVFTGRHEVHVYTGRGEPPTDRTFVDDEARTLRAAATTPDGRLVVVADDRGELTFVHVDSLRVLGHVTVNPATDAARRGVRAVRIGPDGHTLLAAARDGTLRVLDLPGLTERHVLRPGDERLLSAAFVDERRAVSAGTSGDLVLWDVLDGRELARVHAHDDHVWEVGATADRVLSSAVDGTARWFALPGLEPLPDPLGEGRSNRLYGSALAPTGRGAVASNEGTTWLLGGPEPVPLASNLGATMAVAFSPDGSLLATTGFGGEVDLWDAATGQLLRSFDSGKQPGLGLVFTPDGERIVQSDGVGEVRVVRLRAVPERVLALTPRSSPQDHLAALLAVSAWEHVVELVTREPELAGEHEALATALIALGRDDEALQALERADADAPWIGLAAELLRRQ